MKKPATVGHIPSLDGMRCFAVLLVFASHAFYDAGRGSVLPGSFGVTVFFFLSGYLITTLLRQEAETTGNISVRKFFLRRALRILPPFYIVFSLAVCAGWWLNLGHKIEMDPKFLFGQLLYATNYLIAEHGFGLRIAPGMDVLWSLSVEEHFYLLYPFVFLLIRRAGTPQRQAAVLTMLCVAILVWRCWLVVVAGAPHERTYVATDTRADSILFGCILGLWQNPMLDEQRISERVLKYLLLPAGLLGLVLAMTVSAPIFEETFRYSLQGLCLFPVFMTVIRFPSWGLVAVLNWRPVKWLGVISYTIYLCHRIVLMAVWTELKPNLFPQYVAISVLLTVGFAALLYYAIERPLARLRRRAHNDFVLTQPTIANVGS